MRNQVCRLVKGLVVEKWSKENDSRWFVLWWFHCDAKRVEIREVEECLSKHGGEVCQGLKGGSVVLMVSFDYGCHETKEK